VIALRTLSAPFCLFLQQTPPAKRPSAPLPGYGIFDGRLFATSSKGWTASVYATNLFGEVYKVAALGDGLGSFQEVFGQPRRFGVEITKSW
jgi:outer membrane receptor protein involved in Fe transport